MIWLLATLLLIVPWLEFWVMVRLDISWGFAGFWCVATALAGWYFARREELSFWTELESDVQNRRIPTIEGIDAMLVLLGGWSLIVPGLLTDLAGTAFLVKPFRDYLIDTIRRLIRIRLL